MISMCWECRRRRNPSLSVDRTGERRPAVVAGRWPSVSIVRVRPVPLSASPAPRRYQYHRSGSKPPASTCTERASLGSAPGLSPRPIRRNPSSAATSQRNSISSPPKPPPPNGSAARRVHRTTHPESGSPEPIPSENGFLWKRGLWGPTPGTRSHRRDRHEVMSADAHGPTLRQRTPCHAASRRGRRTQPTAVFGLPRSVRRPVGAAVRIGL